MRIVIIRSERALLTPVFFAFLALNPFFARAAEWEVMDLFSVNGASMFRSTTTIIVSTNQPAELWVSTSAVTPHLYVSTSGYVGIGTAAPGTRLDVQAAAADPLVQTWRNSSSVVQASMTAAGTLYAKTVTNLSLPTANSDAANKAYVDAAGSACTPKMQIFTANGTWSWASNGSPAMVWVAMVGGGGGGGGQGTGSGGDSGGGGGSGMGIIRYPVAVSADVTVTIGAAGTAGSGSGGAGGNTSFGALTVLGGSGGVVSNGLACLGGSGGGANGTAGGPGSNNPGKAEQGPWGCASGGGGGNVGGTTSGYGGNCGLGSGSAGVNTGGGGGGSIFAAGGNSGTAGSKGSGGGGGTATGYAGGAGYMVVEWCG